MDPLPYIPNNPTNHDVLPLIRGVFQDTLTRPQYPENVAENMKLSESAIVECHQEANNLSNGIKAAELEVMQLHAQAMLDLRNIINQEPNQVRSILTELSRESTKIYGLLEMSAIYPSKLRQQLDFTWNPELHTCKESKSFRHKKYKKNLLKTIKLQEETVEMSPLLVEVLFQEFRIGEVYKKKIKMINTNQSPQTFSHSSFAPRSPFRLKLVAGSCWLAPGMRCEFIVQFTPENNGDQYDSITFKMLKGRDIVVKTIATREPPKLVCYIFNWSSYFAQVGRPMPGAQLFKEHRRVALNNCVDCGACLLGSHAILTVLFKNQGSKGQFFIAEETEWAFATLNGDRTRNMELVQGCFSIFPTYFEAATDEVTEIFIIFVPLSEGLFTEKIVLVCDNYSYQEIEIVGDGMPFNKSKISVDLYLFEETRYYNGLAIFAVNPNQSCEFTLSIRNDSAIVLEYYFAIPLESRVANKKAVDAKWIQIKNTGNHLPPFSTTDVTVVITVDGEFPEHYYTDFRFLCEK